MRGQWLRLTPARRIVSDLCWFAARTPIGGMNRRMNIAPLVAARAALAERPPWSALLVRAFALVAQRMPEMRRAYVSLPWPHLYQYPGSVGGVVTERESGGEPGLFIARVKHPADRSIREIAGHLAHAKTAPLKDVKDFKPSLILARFPLPIRRLVWWYAMNVGRQRANYFPTFLISLLGEGGTAIQFPVTPFTMLLNIGPIGEDGSVTLNVGFDHRGMDGAVVGKAMAELEATLNGEIVGELQLLRPDP
jgi:hypothetical protein